MPVPGLRPRVRPVNECVCTVATGVRDPGWGRGSAQAAMAAWPMLSPRRSAGSARGPARGVRRRPSSDSTTSVSRTFWNTPPVRATVSMPSARASRWRRRQRRAPMASWNAAAITAPAAPARSATTRAMSGAGSSTQHPVLGRDVDGAAVGRRVRPVDAAGERFELDRRLGLVAHPAPAAEQHRHRVEQPSHARRHRAVAGRGDVEHRLDRRGPRSTSAAHSRADTRRVRPDRGHAPGLADRPRLLRASTPRGDGRPG